MKPTRFLSLMLSLLLMFFVVACETEREDAMEDTGYNEEPVTITEDDNETYFFTTDRDYTYEERNEFRNDVEAAKAKLDREIAQLEARANDASGEAKEEYNEQIRELKEERKELETKWNEFENTSENNWEAFKADVNDIWDNIENTWDDVDVEVSIKDNDNR